MNDAVITLYEGHYHHGVAVLINSLHAAGFRGTAWVGFRGELPPWLPAATANADEPMFSPASGLTVRFVRLATKIHLTNYKPDFLLTLADRVPEARRFAYIDPDIVVRAPWSFFEEWIDGGVAVCGDVNEFMPATHPLRAAWMKLAGGIGLSSRHSFHLYANGGFVGVSRPHLDFVRRWRDLIHALGQAGGDLGILSHRDRTMPFCLPDQDTLNAALMSGVEPVAWIGGEGMDFRPGGYLMSHALGSPKPWTKRYLREALRGFPPTRADKEFWKHVTSPIPVLPDDVVRRRRRAIGIAALLGRFYRRS